MNYFRTLMNRGSRRLSGNPLRGRQPRLEPLEDRTVPTVLTYQPAGLASLLLKASGKSVVVMDQTTGQVVASGPASQVSAVQITGSVGGAASLTVDLNATLNPIPITFTGQSGNDTINVVDQSTGLDSYILSGSVLNSNDGAQVTSVNVANQLYTTQCLASVWFIGSTAAGVTTTVDAGPGNSTITYLPAAGAPDGPQGPLFVQGRSSYLDSFGFLSEAPVSHSYQFGTVGDAGVLTRDGMAAITYQNFTYVQLGIQNESPTPLVQQVTVLGTPAGTVTTLNDGGLNETTVSVANQGTGINALKGTLELDTNGQLALNIFDAGNPVSHTWNITSNEVTRTGMAPISFFGVSQLLIEGGSAGDTFNVQSTLPNIVTAIESSGGNNVVKLSPTDQDANNLQGVVDVFGAATGTTSIVVNDQAHAVSRTWQVAQELFTPGPAGTALYSFDPTTDTLDFFLACRGVANLTVNGGAAGNTYNVQGIGPGAAVTLNTGDGDDTVNVGDSEQTLDELAGTLTVNGQGGNNTLNINAQGEEEGNEDHAESENWYSDHVDLFWGGGGLSTGNTTITYKGVQQTTLNDVIGPTSSTHQILANLNTHLTINGGAENDHIFPFEAAGGQLTIKVTGFDAGTITDNVSFSGVDVVEAGGDGNVAFKFLPGAFLFGGGYMSTAYSGTASFDFSGFGTPITVSLDPSPNILSGATSTVTTVRDGVSQAVMGTFGGISKITGTPGADTLVGASGVDNTWSLTGANAGQVDGVTFAGFENLQGGDQADTFVFVNGAKVAGVVDGGAGTNTLDYSGYKGNVTVDLPLGSATLVGSSVKNILDVVGSIGNDILVGNGTGNTLTGGTGRNILIAGAAPGTLLGNSDDDILIGGSTSYDKNLTALNAIMAEWSSSDSYQVRAFDVIAGGGKNGSTTFNSDSVFYNGGPNTMLGGAGTDLFFGKLQSDITDYGFGGDEIFVLLQ
jgi:Ca2+-binding RTX toxin-like protein